MPFALFCLQIRSSLHSRVRFPACLSLFLKISHILDVFFSHFICDGRVDCADASDELICSNKTENQTIDSSLVLNVQFDPTTFVLRWEQSLHNSSNPKDYGVFVFNQSDSDGGDSSSFFIIVARAAY